MSKPRLTCLATLVIGACMGFFVPVEMRESYIRTGERIAGRAEYGRFRPLRK